MLTSVIDSWVFRFVSYTSCDDDATCHPLDRYSNQRNGRYTNDGNAWDFERSFVNFTRLNFQLASKSNGASWFESKNDGIVTGMYYSRWFLKSTLFFKIHRNSKRNIIVYTDRIDADSRYYIFHREILYHARKEIKFIFKRKKYQLLLLLFFIIQWGIRIDRWSDMQPTYPLETNLGDFLRVFYVPESQDFYALSLSFETLIILQDISRKGCI